MKSLLCACLIFTTVVSANHLSGKPVKRQLDEILTNFMERNNFHGAQLGVIHGSNLVYAEAKGSIHGKQADAEELVPILDLSKVITSIAILQLVEKGYISLEDTVFGDFGILYYVEPLPGSNIDPRIYNITIDHLLRHSAGWDESSRPVLDPMMNKALLALGYEVPDITQELGYAEDQYLHQDHIIQYMFSQPLQFTPGKSTVHSNFGYCILGRVIEIVTEMYYDDYVRENILEPAGMWHTRIGPGQHNSQKELRREKDEAYESVLPQTLDSTLGWYSNIYDIARLFTALYSRDEIILRRVTLQYALRKNLEITNRRRCKWAAMGLNVNGDGSLVLDDKNRGWGVNVLFYKEALTTPFHDQQLNDYFEDNNNAFIFIGVTNKYKKHLIGLEDSILSLTLNSLQQNAYVSDLGDIELNSDNKATLLKQDLDEHKLLSYVNAMKLAGYFPTWIQGYNFDGRTRFVVIFELASETIQLQYKLIKASSLSKIYRTVSRHARDYQLSMVQTLQSVSHSNNVIHIVLMKRTNDPKLTMFNLNVNLRAYVNELPILEIDGYKPVVQSISSRNDNQYVSYVLQKPLEATTEHTIETQSFTNLTLEELENKTRQLGPHCLHLSYVDSYETEEGWKFSAIFKYKTLVETSLKTQIKNEHLVGEIYETNEGFIPNIVVAYTQNSELFYLVQWQKTITDDQ